ncbi:MAG: nitroreductase family protein [Bacteroidales bacterium]|nr:nitroreductase family protein [Bacteroidales bacterium]
MSESANPVIDAILKRRSIRRYSGKPVDKSEIILLLKAGMYAPSARNEQPWHFIVIDKRDLLDRIREVHPYASMLSGAALAILVCGDENLELSKGYWSVDCSASTQNILLAAHALGLGAVWLGVYPRQERQDGIRKIFDLPAHIHPFSLISIGHPAEEKGLPDRFKEDRIRWNEW